MAAEPSKTEIQTLFKRLRAAPANKVAGSGRGPPDSSCWAVALRPWPALRPGPGGLRAALRRLLGRPGRGPWGGPGQSGRGRRHVAGGGGAAEQSPQPGCLSAFALVVLRLRRQEPELGQYHLRRLPVHRLLRRPQVPGRAPQLHQVRGERGTAGRPGAAIPPWCGSTQGLGEKPYHGAITLGFMWLAHWRFWVTQYFQDGVSKAPQAEHRHVVFASLAETRPGLGIVGAETRVWCVNLASKAAVWCTYLLTRLSKAKRGISFNLSGINLMGKMVLAFQPSSYFRYL